MFSYFVFLFSASVSFWASVHFFRSWKKTKNPSYWEFSAFFFTLGIAFISPFLTFFGGYPVLVLAARLVNFFILFSFAFVMRAVLRFQHLTFISANLITMLVAASAIGCLAVGVYFPPHPEVKDGLIYWHYSFQNFIVYFGLLILYTSMTAMVFFSNMANIQKEKKTIPLFLGIGFLSGGLSVFFLGGFHTFFPVLFGFVLFFLAFVFTALFIIASRRKEA